MWWSKSSSGSPDQYDPAELQLSSEFWEDLQADDPGNDSAGLSTISLDSTHRPEQPLSRCDEDSKTDTETCKGSGPTEDGSRSRRQPPGDTLVETLREELEALHQKFSDLQDHVVNREKELSRLEEHCQSSNRELESQRAENRALCEHIERLQCETDVQQEESRATNERLHNELGQLQASYEERLYGLTAELQSIQQVGAERGQESLELRQRIKEERKRHRLELKKAKSQTKLAQAEGRKLAQQQKREVRHLLRLVAEQQTCLTNRQAELKQQRQLVVQEQSLSALLRDENTAETRCNQRVQRFLQEEVEWHNQQLTRIYQSELAVQELDQQLRESRLRNMEHQATIHSLQVRNRKLEARAQAASQRATNVERVAQNTQGQLTADHKRQEKRLLRVIAEQEGQLVAERLETKRQRRLLEQERLVSKTLREDVSGKAQQCARLQLFVQEEVDWHNCQLREIQRLQVTTGELVQRIKESEAITAQKESVTHSLENRIEQLASELDAALELSRERQQRLETCESQFDDLKAQWDVASFGFLLVLFENETQRQRDQQQLSKLREALDLANHRRRVAAEELSNLRNELEFQQTAFEHQADSLGERTRCLRELRDSCSEQEWRISQLDGEVRKLKIALDVNEQKKRQVQQEFEASRRVLTAENSGMSFEIDRLRDRFRALENEHEASQKLLAEKEAELETARIEVESLQRVCAAGSERIQDLTGFLTTRMVSLEQEKAALRRDNASLLSSHRDARLAWTRQRTEWENQLASTKAQAVEAKRGLSDLQKECGSYRRQIQHLVQNEKSASEQIEELSSEREQAQQQVQQLKFQRQECEERLVLECLNNASLRNAIFELRFRLQDAQRNCVDHLQAYSQLESRLQLIQEDNLHQHELSEQSRQRQIAERQEFRQERFALLRRVELVTDEASRRALQQRSLQSKIEGLEQKLQTLQQALSDAKATMPESASTDSEREDQLLHMDRQLRLEAAARRKAESALKRAAEQADRQTVAQVTLAQMTAARDVERMSGELEATKNLLKRVRSKSEQVKRKLKQENADLQQELASLRYRFAS